MPSTYWSDAINTYNSSGGNQKWATSIEGVQGTASSATTYSVSGTLRMKFKGAKGTIEQGYNGNTWVPPLRGAMSLELSSNITTSTYFPTSNSIDTWETGTRTGVVNEYSDWADASTKSFSISLPRGSSSYTVYLCHCVVDEPWAMHYRQLTQTMVNRICKYAVTVPALPTYAVTYNANGGSGAPGQQTRQHDGSAIQLSSTVPTRAGYTFVKWNTAANGSGTSYYPGDSYSANASVTLYAIWQIITYPVTYNANGGSGAPGSQTKTYGTGLTLSSTIPTRTSYSFYHWNTNTSNTGAAYQAGATYTGNAALSLYAIWNPFIYYDANGGTGGPSYDVKVFGRTFTLTNIAPTRSGYSFKRWNTNTSDTGTAYSPGGSYTSNDSVTLYAIWNRTVTYDANGGSNAPSAQTSVSTSAITVTSDKPVKAGWRFAKWNTKADGTGTDYGPGTSNPAYPASNPSITLYAQWERVVTSLVIGDVTAKRVSSSSSTTESDEGEYAYVTVPFAIYGAAAATVTVSATCTSDGSDTPTVSTSPASVVFQAQQGGDARSGEFHVRASTCDVENRYTFAVTLSAANGSATQTAVIASKSVVLPAAFFTMDVKAGGHGVAFGKPATRDAFDVGMPAYFSQAVRIAESLSLPVYKYAAAPAESSLPSKPCIVVCEDKSVYLAY